MLSREPGVAIVASRTWLRLLRIGLLRLGVATGDSIKTNGTRLFFSYSDEVFFSARLCAGVVCTCSVAIAFDRAHVRAFLEGRKSWYSCAKVRRDSAAK